MRRIRKISSQEEGFRTEVVGRFRVPRRNPVEPEPIGTIVLLPFRISGYDKDCDGSLMARLECINTNGEDTGWDPDHIGLYGDSGFVVTESELAGLSQ